MLLQNGYLRNLLFIDIETVPAYGSWELLPDVEKELWTIKHTTLKVPDESAEDGYLKRAGVPLGKLSAKEFIPEHDLALSTLISPQLPAITLTRDQALSYLRKDEFQPDQVGRGWTLVQYGGLNLGWIKILPGRINNYYPKEWRILRRDP